jgi:organic radical activating enzyme
MSETFQTPNPLLRTQNSQLRTHRGSFAEISEIFSSLQGEGPYLGVKQVFVRFGRCNMHCHYCDELEKMQAERFSVLSLDEVMASITSLSEKEGEPHSISLTGGEPLFYVSFLENLLPSLKAKGFKTYLETNGTLTRELERVIRDVDIIAMDLKPPSSTGDRAYWKEHEDFLKCALRKDVFVKVVVTADTQEQDIERCIALLRNVNPNIPFILQPQSEAFGISVKALSLIQSRYFGAAKRILADVRVIPQMHKIWGVR